MKPFKKALSALLLSAVVFSMTGCGLFRRNTKKSESEPDSSEISSQPGPGTSVTPSQNPSEEPSEEPSEQPSEEESENTSEEFSDTSSEDVSEELSEDPSENPSSGSEVGPQTDPDTDPENQVIDENPEPIELPEPIPHELAEEVIGISGGIISDTDDNIIACIPENALDENTTITARYIDEPSFLGDNAAMNFMGAVEFGPSGTTFNEEVEVSMKLAKTTTNSTISIFCYNEEEDVWDYVTTGDVSGENVTFNVTHFSRYKGVDITPAMLNKFNELVHEAQANGYDDQWIINSYKEYLIEEQRIMDEYAIYEGLYYEACGLYIGGDYYYEGKEGDPNVLNEMVGESNQVGDKYGVSTVASQIVSRDEYVKAKQNATDNQILISVTVIIDYKMVKPDIQLSADKSILDPGEETIVTVYTHYANPNNQKYPDIVLPNYPLTLPYHLKHFTTDVNELTTDETGYGLFSVTAIDEGTETVKVMFYVAGYFGQYSANYIKFKCGGDFSIIGSISETRSGTFNAAPNIVNDMTWVSDGTFEFTLTYDFMGALDYNEDGTVRGILQFYNFEIEYSGTEAIYEAQRGNDLVTYRFTMYEEEEIIAPRGLSYGFTGDVDENGSCTLNTSVIDSFLYIMFYGNWFESLQEEGMEALEIDTPLVYMISFTNPSNLLLDFSLEEGEYANSCSFMKDVYATTAYKNGVSAEELYFNVLSCSGSTSQEIMVVDNRNL